MIKKNYLIWITLLSAYLLGTCAFAKNIEIDSNPSDTEIFVFSSDGGQEVNLGKTPYKGSIDDVASKIGGGNAFVIELRKDGFEPHRFIFSTISKNEIALKVNMKVAKNIEMVQDFDLLVAELFDVQRMVRTRDFVSGLEKIDLIEKKFPHFSVVHEMKGSIFYVQGEFTRSLASYRKAFSLNSKNLDAYRMKTYLEKRFGADKVAEQSAGE